MRNLGSWLLRYGIPVLAVAGTAAVVLSPQLGKGAASVPFFAVLISAWYGGLGPGIFATALTTAIALIIMLNRGDRFPPWQILQVVLFVAGGMLISLLVEALHAARRRADVNRRWLSAVLASIGDAVIVTDEQDRVIFMNAMAESLCGWTHQDASGQPLAEVFRIISEETRQPTEAPVARALRDGLVVGLANHTLLISAGGAERPIHDSAAPVRDDRGSITGVVLVFRDDTDRRRYEQQLVEANRRKDEFLAMLAHELRNPLAAIRSAVEVLDMPGAEDDRQWASQVIGRQIHHLTRLLDDLLDVSRITRGLIEVRKQLIDACLVINQAIESVRPQIDDGKHRLEVSISPQILRLEADPVRLEQVLVNLLSNAAKYTAAGGRIELSAQHAEDQIIFRVTDTGMGIAPETLPHIFDLFAQGERTLARSEGGLGVGLTIVKKLMELHGGSVSARSEGVGQGSEFIVRLPAAERPSPAESIPATPTAERPGSRILIVEDNKDLARGMARLLKLLGHKVQLAHDGPEGIEAARVSRPEVILLNIGLPNLDGYYVARVLRQEVGLTDALIIAITGYGQEEDRRHSQEAGIDHHLTKPVDLKTIAELINHPG
jgi:PAS domain S-box-containing protein